MAIDFMALYRGRRLAEQDNRDEADWNLKRAREMRAEQDELDQRQAAYYTGNMLQNLQTAMDSGMSSTEAAVALQRAMRNDDYYTSLRPEVRALVDNRVADTFTVRASRAAAAGDYDEANQLMAAIGQGPIYGARKRAMLSDNSQDLLNYMMDSGGVTRNEAGEYFTGTGQRIDDIDAFLQDVRAAGSGQGGGGGIYTRTQAEANRLRDLEQEAALSGGTFRVGTSANGNTILLPVAQDTRVGPEVTLASQNVREGQNAGYGAPVQGGGNYSLDRLIASLTGGKLPENSVNYKIPFEGMEYTNIPTIATLGDSSFMPLIGSAPTIGNPGLLPGTLQSGTPLSAQPPALPQQATPAQPVTDPLEEYQRLRQLRDVGRATLQGLKTHPMALPSTYLPSYLAENSDAIVGAMPGVAASRYIAELLEEIQRLRKEKAAR